MLTVDPTLSWRTLRDIGFNGHVGPIRFAKAGPETFLAALDLQAHHVNAGGVCHGGVMLTLADVAMGAAAFQIGGKHPCATIELDSHFIAAGKQGQTLIAEARLVRHVRELAFMQAELWSGERQVMRASGIWKFLASRTPTAGA